MELKVKSEPPDVFEDFQSYLTPQVTIEVKTESESDEDAVIVSANICEDHQYIKSHDENENVQSNGRPNKFRKKSEDHEEFGEFGDIQVQIGENKLCKKSENTGYHIERKNGIMNIQLYFDSPPVV